MSMANFFEYRTQCFLLSVKLGLKKCSPPLKLLLKNARPRLPRFGRGVSELSLLLTGAAHCLSLLRAPREPCALGIRFRFLPASPWNPCALFSLPPYPS